MKPLLLALRLLVGGLFAGHGAQKLFGAFGGHGIDGTGKFFDSLGIKPGREAAIAAGAAELGGGALLATGIAKPVAGAALTGTMVQAIRTVHGPKGPWATDGGWEYNAVLIAAIAAILEEGSGPLWTLGALAAGAVGPDLTLQALRSAGIGENGATSAG